MWDEQGGDDDDDEEEGWGAVGVGGREVGGEVKSILLCEERTCSEIQTSSLGSFVARTN